MDPDLKILADESIHPVVYHQHRTVCGIEDREIEYGPQEVMMFAKRFYPVFKLKGPFFLILIKGIFPFEQEFKLIVAVEFEPEHTHQVHVEFVKMAEIRIVVLPDPKGHRIHHSEGVAAQEIFDLYKVNEVLQQGRFQRQLCRFKDVILI